MEVVQLLATLLLGGIGIWLTIRVVGLTETLKDLTEDVRAMTREMRDESVAMGRRDADRYEREMSLEFDVRVALQAPGRNRVYAAWIMNRSAGAQQPIGVRLYDEDREIVASGNCDARSIPSGKEGRCTLHVRPGKLLTRAKTAEVDTTQQSGITARSLDSGDDRRGDA